MKLTGKNKRMLSCPVAFLAILISLSCTPTATQTLYVYHGKDYASLTASKDIDIVQIDKRMVNIKYPGEDGSEYSRVTIKPGRHEVVLNVPWFWEGSVIFVEANFAAGREYIAKYKIGDRVSMLSRAWRCKVWIEDVRTGEVVSTFIRNI